MPKFSVIVPLYNKAQFIKECVQSILNQTITDFELLVIDDCSTDESLKIVQQIEDKRLQIIRHQQNSGLSASRNTGIQQASGEIISFLDADDLWKPTFLKSIGILEQQFPDCDIFGTDYEEHFNRKITLPKKNLPEYAFGKLLKIEDFFTASLFNPIYCYSSVAFSAKVFQTIGDFDTKIAYGEDIDFNIRANAKFQLAYFCEPLAIYRMGSGTQITDSGVGNKPIVNFSKFKTEEQENSSLKKYLNANRYYFATQYKNQQQHEKLEELKATIDYNDLSPKQIIMLNCPFWVFRLLKKIKKGLLKKGVKVTPY